MTWERTRAGIIGGVVGIVPLAAIMLLTKLGIVGNAGATNATLLAFPCGILLGGGVAGYLAGQARRRRREFKAVIGASAGLVAAIIYGGALEGVFIVRYVAIPPELRDATLGTHPLRVSFAIMLMSTVLLVCAMLVTQLTARALPPPRPGRRTRELPSIQLPQQPPVAPKR